MAAAVLALALAAGACARRTAPPARAVPAARTEALLAEARAAEGERRYDLARERYRRAAREAPDRPSAAHAWRELASALLFWGEIAEAEAALERVVALAPEEVSAWHDLGIVRQKRGHSAGAERALRRAVALAPAEPRPRIALGALLVAARRYDRALVEYRALERLQLPDRIRRAVARAIALLESERAGGAPADP
jgi:Flp pilus assembly protein TadD